MYLLNWTEALTLTLLLKLPVRGLSLDLFYKPVSDEVLLYLYKSTIWLCM